MSTEERFWSKVNKTDTCWLWKGGKSPRGYGKFWNKDHRSGDIRAHRQSWIFAHGPIPEDLLLCHTCDTPSCVNPSHLFLGTAQDNEDDKKRKGRQARGELNNHAKLTEEKVIAIRGITSRTHRDIAAQYGVTRALISYIRRREIWRHVVC